MSSQLSIAVRGTGHAVPAKALCNDDFTKWLDTSDEWIRTRTGIRERRIAGDGESTLGLAVIAAQAALADAKVPVEALDLIIVATITPEYPTPATACFLQAALGVTDIPAYDISAACSGFVYALLQAAHFIHTGSYRTVLVVSTECMSRITDYEDRATCILFGDGAGAAVVTAAEREDQGIFHWTMGADGGGAPLIFVPAGGAKEPASARTVNERLHYLKMRGREVYKFAVTKMQEVIHEAIDASGLSPDDLAIVIPHQSNLRIIESATEKLGIAPEKVYINIERFGNTSGASIGIALDELCKNGRIRRGDWVLLAAFGAGLTWASALIRW